MGRLPLQTGSVAALHAGAALHCWPTPALAVRLCFFAFSTIKDSGPSPCLFTDCLVVGQIAEISRVLRPGGVFVASTFLKASAPLGQLLQNDDIVRPLNAVTYHASPHEKVFCLLNVTQLQSIRLM